MHFLYIAFLTETLKTVHTASVELDRDYKTEYSDLQNPSIQHLVKIIKEQVRVNFKPMKSLPFLLFLGYQKNYKYTVAELSV